MDLLLVLPSILLAVWQYSHNIHLREVKFIQKNLAKILDDSSLDESKLQPESSFKKDLDFIRAFVPKPVSQWLIQCFVIYLVAIAACYFVTTMGVFSYDSALYKKEVFMITVKTIFALYMVGLAVATTWQIWKMAQKKKEISKTYNDVEKNVKIYAGIISARSKKSESSQ